MVCGFERFKESFSARSHKVIIGLFENWIWKISTFRQTSTLFQRITFNAPLVKLDFSSVPMVKKIKTEELSRSGISLILQRIRRSSYIAEFVVNFMNFEIHRDQFVISPWLLTSYRKSWDISFLKNGLLTHAFCEWFIWAQSITCQDKAREFHIYVKCFV